MLGVVFPDAEIAYTTMYFEVLFQENFSLNLSPEVVLVLVGGTATAVLFKTADFRILSGTSGQKNLQGQ